MAKLSAQEFIIKYIARFANNTTGQIDEADLRDFARDIADSFGGSLDYEQLNLEWNSETSYNTTDNQYSEAFGRLYKSKQDGNIGHQPPSAPNVDGDYEDDWWEEISKAASSLFVEWEPKAYGSGLVIVFYDNTFRKLNVQQRPFLSQDIVAETDEEKWTVIGGSGPSHFLGKYTTLAALETAIPTATDGDYAIVDPGAGTPAVEYIWDAEEGWVAGGEAVAEKETLEFTAIAWGATVTITIPTGIKSHKFKVLIPSGSPTASGTLTVASDGNGVFCSGTIYNNDSVAKTVNLPATDLRGQGLLQAISIPANKALDISFKNDGTKRIWQYTLTE